MYWKNKVLKIGNVSLSPYHNNICFLLIFFFRAKPESILFHAGQPWWVILSQGQAGNLLAKQCTRMGCTPTSLFPSSTRGVGSVWLNNNAPFQSDCQEFRRQGKKLKCGSGGSTFPLEGLLASRQIRPTETDRQSWKVGPKLCTVKHHVKL